MSEWHERACLLPKAQLSALSYLRKFTARANWSTLYHYLTYQPW
jgi:hypothetical protein